MRVAFIHIGTLCPIASMMVAQVRSLGLKATQLTDMNAPQIPGITQLIRKSWNGMAFMTWKLEHLAGLEQDEWLILDTDIIVQRLFKPEKKIVLTRRDHSIIAPDGRDVGKEMPYNAGVVYCEEPQFWQDCLDECRKMPENAQDWYGDQLAIKIVRDKYDCQELSCNDWNYTPESVDEDTSHKGIIHYKGPRKTWMVKNHQHLLTGQPKVVQNVSR